MSWIVRKEVAERRQKLIADAGVILKKAHAENREMNPDENKQFEQMHADADRLRDEIATIDRQETAERSLEQRIGRDDAAPKAERNKELESRAFRKWLVSGKDGLNQEERAAFFAYTQEQRAASGLSATTSGAGAEFVPQAFADNFVAKLKYYGGVRKAGATILTTESGNPFQVPFLDDVSHTGELIGESVAVTDDDSNDPDTSSITLGGYMFSSKVVRVPMQLIQDSAFPVEDWLTNALVERIGRVRNYYETVGTGSSQPYGIVARASAGKTAASTSAITYLEVLDLLGSLDYAYKQGGNVKLMFHQNTELALKKLLDGNDRPLWDGGNIALQTPPTINGHAYVINNDMLQLGGTSRKVMIAADFSRYMVRDVVGVQLARLDQKYMDQLQIGFICWQRGDSNLIDKAAAKYLITPAS